MAGRLKKNNFFCCFPTSLYCLLLKKLGSQKQFCIYAYYKGNIRIIHDFRVDYTSFRCLKSTHFKVNLPPSPPPTKKTRDRENSCPFNLLERSRIRSVFPSSQTPTPPTPSENLINFFTNIIFLLIHQSEVRRKIYVLSDCFTK